MGAALVSAKGSKGGTWLIEGPAGIGKTRLVQWMEEQAVKRGFQVSWGYCLKESNLPFFPFQQIFRHSGQSAPGPVYPEGELSDSTLPVLTIYEDERPHRVLDRVAVLSGEHKSLVVSRERPSNVRKQLPALAQAALVLQLTKTGEGEECLHPGQVDAIGEQLLRHLKGGPGAVVALTGLDYLVSQNGFQPVLKLVQFLREEADQAEGHVLISINPLTLEKRELALLEGEGEVLRGSDPKSEGSPSGPEPPATTMLHYLDVLEREAPKQPRLLVLDDVQWADPDSLRTLQFLARNIHKLPVLLVGTYRLDDWRTPEEKGEQVVEEILSKIEEEGELSRITLGGLNELESQELAEKTIGLPMRPALDSPEGTLLSVFQRAEGNPYFVRESMRQLAQQGLLRKEAGRAVIVEQPNADSGPPIPPTLKRLVERRFAMLAPDEADLLRWAAVSGSEFELPPLAAVFNKPAPEVHAILNRLEHDLHILEPVSGGRWAFGHPLVWEVTISSFDPRELERRSLAIADWLAEHQPNNLDSVARLYHEAKEPSRGIPWVERALDQAISSYATETAGRYHRWLQELLALTGADQNTRLKKGLAICEKHLHGDENASPLTEVLESLVRIEAATDDLVTAKLLLAYCMLGLDVKKVQGHMEGIERDIARDRIALSPKWAAVRSAIRADVLARQARFREAIAELQSPTATNPIVTERWVLGRELYLLGYCNACLSLRAGARAALLKLTDLTGADGETYLGLLRNTLEGAIAELEGNLVIGEEAYGKGLAVARKLGHVLNTALSLDNMAYISSCRGNYDSARLYIVNGKKFCGRFGLTDISNYLTIVEGSVLWHEERWSDLLVTIRGALSTSTGTQTGRTQALVLEAEGLIELGDPQSARKVLEEAELRKAELGPGEAANLLRVRSRLECLDGNPRAGRRSLEEAMKMLEAHPNLYWGAWVNAEMARWESVSGNPKLAQSFSAAAGSLFKRSGVLPSGRPKWLTETNSRIAI